MLNKKILFGLMAFALLPMISPNVSMAEDENDSDLMYFRLGYKPTYVGSHTIEKAKVSGAPDAASYDPKYEFNLYGGSVGVGKYFGSETRAELEVAANLAFSLNKDSSSDFHIEGVSGAIKNKGFSYALASLNLYYDIDSGINNIAPYIGAGVGLARVNFMTGSDNISYPVALQFKAGVQTKINNMFPIYAGYTFSYLLKKESDIKPTSDVVKITSSYMLHNADIGFMIVQ